KRSSRFTSGSSPRKNISPISKTGCGSSDRCPSLHASITIAPTACPLAFHWRRNDASNRADIPGRCRDRRLIWLRSVRRVFVAGSAELRLLLSCSCRTHRGLWHGNTSEVGLIPLSAEGIHPLTWRIKRTMTETRTPTLSAATATLPGRLKFGATGDFQHELRRRVDYYFSSSGAKPRDCPRMYAKMAIILAWFV